MFKPEAIFLEKGIENYQLGKELLEKYKDVPKIEIENHKTSDYLVPYTSSGCTAQWSIILYIFYYF